MLSKYKKNLVLILAISVFIPLNSQVYSLSGIIKDAKSADPVSKAVIYENNYRKGTTTNKEGYYFMKLPSGRIHITIKYLGYKDYDTIIFLDTDKELNFNISEDIILTEEVVISANKENQNVEDIKTGYTKLSYKEIDHLPVLFGEADPLKMIQLTPGIQSGKEGNAGFYVRGGGVDQNLIVLDGVHLYNAGHVMGFFSVFNPDVVSGINFSKSGFSAYYGGRLSSIVEVNSIKPSLDDWHFTGGIGIISSRFCVNGPVKNNRSGVILAARRTYFDIVIQPIFSKALSRVSQFFSNSMYNFYDLNFTYYTKIGNKDQINFNFYTGADNYSFNRESSGLKAGSKWGNTTGSVQWNHIFNNDLSMDHLISITEYNFNLNGDQGEYLFDLTSGLRDYSQKSRLFWHINDNHKFIGGWEYIYHNIAPNEIETRTGDFDLEFPDLKRTYSNEMAAFIEDQFDIGPSVRLSMGIRYSMFIQKGPFVREIKDEAGVVYDSTIYNENDYVAFYKNPEPRISARYLINNHSSVKASYTEGYQYIHLATSSSISLPTDIWLSSSDVIPPQKGRQVSAGYYRNFKKSLWETSVELYYKKMQHQTEFLNGIINNTFYNTLDENIAFGNAYSYGVEFFIKKTRGNSKGWISYTLSRTVKMFDEINEGLFYPAKYDRTHDLSAVFMRKLNDKWNMSAIFVFATGKAFTLPIAKYIIQGSLMNEYGKVNDFRMPPYHRLDLSFSRSVKKKKIISEWNFSIYNVYNRANPYFMYYEVKGNLDKYQVEIKLKKVSLFPVIPSITWNMKF